MADSASSGVNNISKRSQDYEEQSCVLHAVPIKPSSYHLLKKTLRIQRDGMMLRVMQSRIAPRNGSEMTPLQNRQRAKRIMLDALAETLETAIRVWVSDALQVQLQLLVCIYRFGCHGFSLEFVVERLVVSWVMDFQSSAEMLPGSISELIPLLNATDWWPITSFQINWALLGQYHTQYCGVNREKSFYFNSFLVCMEYRKHWEQTRPFAEVRTISSAIVAGRTCKSNNFCSSIRCKRYYDD